MGISRLSAATQTTAKATYSTAFALSRLVFVASRNPPCRVEQHAYHRPDSAHFIKRSFVILLQCHQDMTIYAKYLKSYFGHLHRLSILLFMPPGELKKNFLHFSFHSTFRNVYPFISVSSVFRFCGSGFDNLSNVFSGFSNSSQDA